MVPFPWELPETGVVACSGTKKPDNNLLIIVFIVYSSIVTHGNDLPGITIEAMQTKTASSILYIIILDCPPFILVCFSFI